MSRQVYNFKHYRIYECRKGCYIVHNCRKPFKGGHTHIQGKFKTAKDLIYMSYYHTIPDNLSNYLMNSLIRISTCPLYIEEIKEKIEEHEQRHGKKNSCPQ